MSPRQCLVASLFLAYVALCVSARRTLAQADATVADAEAATDDYPVGPCTFKAGRVVWTPPILPDANFANLGSPLPEAVLNGTRRYRPDRVDWAGVVSACRSAAEQEHRLANFFIRSAFHDSMAVDLRQCANGNSRACGGADASMLLTLEELLRPENAYDDFGAITASVVKKIASWYGASVSDTLAVCAAIGTDVLSGGRTRIFGPGYPLRVGRLDRATPAPPNTLPPEHQKTWGFANFWEARGFTVAEAIALMGSHALIDNQACQTATFGVECDSLVEMCTGSKKLKMFTELSTPTIRVTLARSDAADGEEEGSGRKLMHSLQPQQQITDGAAATAITDGAASAAAPAAAPAAIEVLSSRRLQQVVYYDAAAADAVPGDVVHVDMPVADSATAAGEDVGGGAAAVDVVAAPAPVDEAHVDPAAAEPMAAEPAGLSDMARIELCKFTSLAFKNLALQEVLGVAAGEILAEAAAEEPPPLFNVNWKSAGCKLAAASVNFPIANTCPHYNKWPYTSQDAFFALSAQGVDTRYSPTDNRVTSEIRAAVHAYTDVPTWDRAYVPAFHKLVSSIAVFVDNPRTGEPYYITGYECPSQYVPDPELCPGGLSLTTGQPVSCRGCDRGNLRRCDPCCMCQTLFTKGRAKRCGVPGAADGDVPTSLDQVVSQLTAAAATVSAVVTPAAA